MNFKYLFIYLLNIYLFIRIFSYLVASHLSKKAKENRKLNINLKEFSSNEDKDVILPKDEHQPLHDTYTKSPSASNHSSSDKSALRNFEGESESEDDQKLAFKSFTSSSYRGGDRLEGTTKEISNNFLFKQISVRPVNSILVTKTFSSKHKMSSQDAQDMKPSVVSFDTQRNSSSHYVQNDSLMEKINKKEISATTIIKSESSSSSVSPEKVIPPSKESISKIGTESVRVSMAHVDTTTKLLTQEDLNSIAEYMEVRFEVLENPRRAIITLRNKGLVPIERKQWSIHFCITTGLELGHLVHRPEGYVLPGETSIKLTHFNGCAYKLEPTRDFKPIIPGSSLAFKVNIGPTIARSDLGPKWYVTAEGLQPRTISNTADEGLSFVFVSGRKGSWDRFGNNDVADLGKAPLLVIPTPLMIVELNESKKLSIDSEWVVIGGPGVEEETSFLAGNMKQFCRISDNFLADISTFVGHSSQQP